MARRQRVTDDELENDQLADMLGGKDSDNDQQGDDGDDIDAEGSSSEEDKAGEADRDSRSDDKTSRGRDNQDRQSKQDDRGTARDQTTKQKEQQTQTGIAVLDKMRPEDRKKVLDDAVKYVRGRTQPVFNKLEMENRKLTDKMKLYEAASGAAKEYQLNPQEVLLGHRLVAAWKKDKVATLKYLITQAKADGANINLGEGAKDLDMKAIRAMIDDAVAPMRGEVDVRQRDHEARGKAQEMITEFYSNNPDAQIHERAIAGILERYPDETLQTAWLKLQNWALRNKVDMSKPLGGTQKQPQNGVDRPTNLRGVRNAEELSGETRNRRPAYVNPNIRWEDIIKQEMKDAGYNMDNVP